ncbi:type I-F CRISPR-associated protein Csy1, partial [Chlamydiales bacterium]|nr:type I-F CRISPR-associated protein Csy1 [Chlamydiales bacterium]
ELGKIDANSFRGNIMNTLSSLIEAFIRKKQEDKGIEFNARSWLDSAAKKASQISIATHVLKFTHSEAKGTNIHACIDSNDDSPYVSTNSLRKAKEDVVGNAGAMDIAGLLHLESDGETFIGLIAKGDSSALAYFAETEEQLTAWINGFKAVLGNRHTSSHSLAKQVYFPVAKNEYHLLAPLYASSLSQFLYDQIKEASFGDGVKEARDCKKKRKYSETILVQYPDLAIQKFGGTKPQNISRLNSVRKGTSYLLKSVPFTWSSVLRPPIEKEGFWKLYGRDIFKEIKGFKIFLSNINGRKNKDIKNRIKSYVSQLLDLLIVTAAKIQNCEPGWSDHSKIPDHEKCWLDPYRKNFIEKDWKKEVAESFATFISRKLESEKIEFGDGEWTDFKNECLEAFKGVY